MEDEFEKALAYFEEYIESREDNVPIQSSMSKADNLAKQELKIIASEIRGNKETLDTATESPN